MLLCSEPILASPNIDTHIHIILSQNVHPLHDYCCALSPLTLIAKCNKIYFTRFLNMLGFPADSFQQVAYMAVGMMERGLASFAMLLLNFYSKVDFIL